MSGAARAQVKKRYFDGTHRSVDPEATVSEARRHMARMGITRVAHVTGLDRLGIPVVMVCRPNSCSLAVSQGKGLSAAAAEASGLMESIESWHAENMAHELVHGSAAELRAERVLADTGWLPQRRDHAYRADMRIPWVCGYDLFSDEATWVPYEMVHTDYRLPAAAGHGVFAATSNGLASGNHHVEAIAHGLSELIERDAMTLWHVRSPEDRAARRVDLATVSADQCRELVERVERGGAALAVWDITSDVGVAAFECTIVERDTEPMRSFYPATGNGCHPCREVAFTRAVTEAAQSRLTAISGARDDLLPERYVEFSSPRLNADLRLQVVAEACPRAYDDAPDFSSETIDEDVDHQLSQLQKIGVERAIVVDLSRPEFGVPVVRVTVPGLECAAVFEGTFSYVRPERVESFRGDR